MFYYLVYVQGAAVQRNHIFFHDPAQEAQFGVKQMHKDMF